MIKCERFEKPIFNETDNICGAWIELENEKIWKAFLANLNSRMNEIETLQIRMKIISITEDATEIKIWYS